MLPLPGWLHIGAQAVLGGASLKRNSWPASGAWTHDKQEAILEQAYPSLWDLIFAPQVWTIFQFMVIVYPLHPTELGGANLCY